MAMSATTSAILIIEYSIMVRPRLLRMYDQSIKIPLTALTLV
jgi:hypothetical protein